MNTPSKLASTNPSLTVIFPTKDNAAEIGSHLRKASTWLHLANEIIVVDSSQDDTSEICREMLPDHAKIVTHPPGLYASWNTAVSMATSKYTYISTVGDSIEAALLEKLLQLAAEHDRDMIVSPPRFINAGKNYRWPIHQMIRDYNIKKLTLFKPQDMHAANYSVLSHYGLCSLSGSFASNITRTETLKNFPFPTEYGGFGDVIWFSNTCGNINFAILPIEGSTFTIHPSSHKTFPPDFMHDTIIALIDRHISQLPHSYRSFIAPNTNAYYCIRKELKKVRKFHGRHMHAVFFGAWLSICKRVFRALSYYENIRIRKFLRHTIKNNQANI